jgi:hypothetical protein
MRFLLGRIGAWTILAVATGCRTPCSSDELKSVFRDFAYVGVFPKTDAYPLSPHGAGALPLPGSLDHGARYVFHTNTRITTEQVAMTILPQRLKEAGFSVLDAPRNAGDFGVPNHGGPIWEIRFSKGYCKGRIYNRVDDALYASRDGWPSAAMDDYIVEVEE